MKVYIEYVLIDNFVIDYLLLKTTLSLTGRVCDKRRLFLCAVLGATGALAFPLLDTAEAISALIKISFGAILLLLSAPFSTLKKYLVTLSVFFGLTFLTGGAVIGVYELFGIDFKSEYPVALVVVPATILLKALTETVKFVSGRVKTAKYEYKCELTLGEVCVKTASFFDTGNNLYDGESPVVVVEKSIAVKFITSLKIPEMRKICVKTAIGESMMTVFKIDSIKVYFGERQNIIYNVSVGVSGQLLGDCPVLLHPALMEVKNEKPARRAQKIS